MNIYFSCSITGGRRCANFFVSSVRPPFVTVNVALSRSRAERKKKTRADVAEQALILCGTT